MELYFHIPFCVRKCAYCDFLSFSDRSACMGSYGEALIRDVRCDGGLTICDRTVTSVYIGGGTPSLMPADFYATLLDEVRERFVVCPDAEISIECNPGTVNNEKLEAYRKAGINRISFGAQSADDEELRLLGRIHTWKDCEAAVRMARDAGFDNLSIDLMMNLPGQTAEHFARTIENAVALEPEHISAYSLIIEEGTKFYERYAENPELLPDEESAAETYELAVKMLADAGYGQYEISNFAKKGRECRHNIGYWRRAEFLGFGIGAASLIGQCRYRVAPDLESYLDALKYEEPAKLDARDIRNETVMLGLRMNEGIDIDRLQKELGSAYADRITTKLTRCVNEGLVSRCGNQFAFTVKGMLVSNAILADLME